jgi:hypothetical protein
MKDLRPLQKSISSQTHECMRDRTNKYIKNNFGKGPTSRWSDSPPSVWCMHTQIHTPPLWRDTRQRHENLCTHTNTHTEMHTHTPLHVAFKKHKNLMHTHIVVWHTKNCKNTETHTHTVAWRQYKKFAHTHACMHKHCPTQTPALLCTALVCTALHWSALHCTELH